MTNAETSTASKGSHGRWMTMVSLILAGEAIFSLPFHVGRFFRPTMLSVFGLTNTELGTLGSVYGVLAMIAYLFGGMVADRFSARKLLTFALISTGLGGFYMMTVPSYWGMAALFAYWGVSTILPFWAALIRATREWGGHDEQGRAFGLLDGGRGLLAASLATIAVAFFQAFFPEDAELVSDAQRQQALVRVIQLYTSSAFGAALFTWLFVPENREAGGGGGASKTRNALRQVLGMPSVWLITMIIICAYCTYKGLDDYSLYAVHAYGMSEVEAAKVSALGAWVRPVAAVGAGFIADRVRASRLITVGFGLLVLSYLVFVTSSPSSATLWVLWLNVVVTCLAIFALRGVYFALLEEVSIPTSVTGTAVGVISLVGYTPDIFIPPLAGWLIDRTPGAAGHHHFFMVLAGFSLLGVIVTMVLVRLAARKSAKEVA